MAVTFEPPPEGAAEAPRVGRHRHGYGWLFLAFVVLFLVLLLGAIVWRSWG